LLQFQDENLKKMPDKEVNDGGGGGGKGDGGGRGVKNEVCMCVTGGVGTWWGYWGNLRCKPCNQSGEMGRPL
jgi:hypothetical protein